MIYKIRNLAIYGGTDRESYNDIKERIEKSNGRTALVFGSVAAILIGIMLVLSFFLEGFMSSRKVYLIGTILSVLIVITAGLSKAIPALTYVSVYLAISVFLLYGIAEFADVIP